MTSPQPQVEKAAVLARSKAMTAAEAAADVPLALSFWADDAIVQTAGNPQVEGKEAVRELYRQFLEGEQLLSYSGSTSHIGVPAAGDLAYEYGVNTLVWAGEGGEEVTDVGTYLAVWEKIDGDWMVRAMSFSSDA